LKAFALSFEGSYLNADSGFDTKAARKVCFNHGITPNIMENPRGRKNTKKRTKRLFEEDRYKERFVCKRTYAWHDKFRSLVIRYDRKETYWLAQNLIVFAMTHLSYFSNQF
jgi:IS5 family transposase